MYLSDYKKKYVISLDCYTITKTEEAVELEDGTKDKDYCIYAFSQFKSICLYKDFEAGSRDYEFDEFIKALQGSRNFFQFGKATNWDESGE